jgi:uncharacterized repeat protein (TIGR03803 family)
MEFRHGSRLLSFSVWRTIDRATCVQKTVRDDRVFVSMEKHFMQLCNRNFRRFCRVAVALLVGVAGFTSNTHGQTSYQVLAAFEQSSSIGANPEGGLIQGADGSLYGTTTQGGAWGFGTVFKIDATGIVTTLHSFNSTDGASPRGGLIQGSDGNFYGLTSSGGAAGFGTAFQLGTTGTLTTLHSFNSSNGASPFGRLIEGSDGHFYGTTQSGGAAGLGTIFKIDAAGTLTTLHTFNGNDGAYPRTGLIQGSDGSFYQHCRALLWESDGIGQYRARAVTRDQGRSAAPVFDAKPGDANHVIDVGRDERSIEREGVRRDGGIEVLDPHSAPFQRGFDATVRLAHGVGPFGSSELHAEEIETRLQRGPAFRTRQPLDAERDLRQHRLRNCDGGGLAHREPLDDRRATLHEL